MADVRTLAARTLPEPPPPEGGRRARRGRALRILGILLILGAVAVGGYVLWLLWGTGITTRAAQSDLRPKIERAIANRPAEIEAEPAAAPEPVVRLPGSAIAIIKIPSIDVDYVVVDGTDTESLKKGPGHYLGTAYPWEDQGRVGIAGHRTTYGAPFWSLNEVREGDTIVLETEYGIFDYRVSRIRIVTPDTGSVLAQTTSPSLVLTTCNPRFSAAERLVVIADRVD